MFEQGTTGRKARRGLYPRRAASPAPLPQVFQSFSLCNFLHYFNYLRKEKELSSSWSVRRKFKKKKEEEACDF